MEPQFDRRNQAAFLHALKLSVDHPFVPKEDHHPCNTYCHELPFDRPISVHGKIYRPTEVWVDPATTWKFQQGRDKKPLGRLDNVVFPLENAKTAIDGKMILLNFKGRAEIVSWDNHCDSCLFFDFDVKHCERCRREWEREEARDRRDWKDIAHRLGRDADQLYNFVKDLESGRIDASAPANQAELSQVLGGMEKMMGFANYSRDFPPLRK